MWVTGAGPLCFWFLPIHHDISIVLIPRSCYPLASPQAHPQSTEPGTVGGSLRSCTPSHWFAWLPQLLINNDKKSAMIRAAAKPVSCRIWSSTWVTASSFMTWPPRTNSRRPSSRSWRTWAQAGRRRQPGHRS